MLVFAVVLIILWQFITAETAINWNEISSAVRTRHGSKASIIAASVIVTGDDGKLHTVHNVSSSAKLPEPFLKAPPPPEQDHPWLVHLTLSDGDGPNDACAGSIISDRHLITAAHCGSFYSRGRLVSAEVFVISIYNDGMTRMVTTSATFIQHPLFEQDRQNFDVAIVVFPPIRDLRPLRLPAANFRPPENKVALVVRSANFSSRVTAAITVSRCHRASSCSETTLQQVDFLSSKIRRTLSDPVHSSIGSPLVAADKGQAIILVGLLVARKIQPRCCGNECNRITFTLISCPSVIQWIEKQTKGSKVRFTKTSKGILPVQGNRAAPLTNASNVAYHASTQASVRQANRHSYPTDGSFMNQPHTIGDTPLKQHSETRDTTGSRKHEILPLPTLPPPIYFAPSSASQFACFASFSPLLVTYNFMLYHF